MQKKLTLRGLVLLIQHVDIYKISCADGVLLLILYFSHYVQQDVQL